MTVARLRRDLSALPLFEGRTPEQLQRVRRQVLRDVLRPLGEVSLVRELLLNIDLIGHDLTAVARPDLEELLLQSLRPELLPALLEGLTEDVRSAAGRRDQRLEPVSRLVRSLSRRLRPTHGDLTGNALQQLLQQGLIGPEELPADLRYQVGVARKADAFLTRWKEHLELFNVLDNAAEYERHLEFFSLILPELLARHEHAAVHGVALEVARHRLDPEPFPGRRARAGAWVEGFGASPAGPEIVWQLMSSDRVRREALLTLCGILGEGGVPLLFRALCECPTRSIRHELCDVLGQLKTPTLRFLASELSKPGQPWYYERNLVGLLGRVGDASRRPLLDRFLRHEDARVRQEAVLAASVLDPTDEDVLLQGLEDPDREVRRVCSREAVRRRGNAPALFAYLRLCLAEASVAEEEALEACSLLASYREGTGHDAAVDLLLDVLREDDGNPRWRSRTRPPRPEALQVAACQALARLKPPRAAPALNHLREKAGRTLRRTAAQALRAIQGP
jgi:HEAT repeat protein